MADEKKKFTALTKTFADILEAKIPDTKFDQFFVEEFVKKLPNSEELEKLLQRVESVGAQDLFALMEEIVADVKRDFEIKMMKSRELIMSQQD